MHVLCETISSFRAAQEHLGDTSAKWWTNSPAVIEHLNALGYEVEWLESNLTRNEANACGYDALAATGLLRPHFADVASALDSPRFEQFLSAQSYIFLVVLLWKLKLLTRWVEVTDGKRLVVGDPKLSSNAGSMAVDRFDEVFAFLAKRMETDSFDFLPVQRASGQARYKEIDQPTATGVFLSLIDMSIGQIVWRFWNFILRGRPIALKSGGPRILVGTSNEAVREILPYLLSAGCTLERMPRTPASVAGEPSALMPGAEAIADALHETCSSWLEKKHCDAIAFPVYERLQKISAELSGAKSAAAALLGRRSPDGAPTVVLSNSLGSIVHRFFAGDLHRRGGSTVIAQHGVSASLSMLHTVDETFGEHTQSQAYLVCSQSAADFYERVGKELSISVPVIGLPNITRRVRHRRVQRALVRMQLGAKRRQRVVMYITGLISNNAVRLPHYSLDKDAYLRMKTVSSEILPKVRGLPVVKFYSTARYLDEDPLMGDAAPPPPVRRLKAGDFRYLRAGADVLILETPLSTLGWAFGSRAPIVYLYDPTMELIPAVKAALADSVFLVDQSNPDWPDTLLEILNRTDVEISAEWEAKRNARESFLRDYIFGPEDPGRRGAEAILDLVRAKAKQLPLSSEQQTHQV